jgi:Domain of unknown function (DUF932)
MTINTEKELDKYIFPVKEEKIYYPSEGNLKTSDDFKSIVRTDTGQIISVMNHTYKLIPNKIIIESLIQQLESIDCKFVVDKLHSYVDNSQMRLSIILPDYHLTDHESKIFLGIQVINSYTGTTSYRRQNFLHRQICSNGMMAKSLFEERSRKHTSGFEFDELQNDIEKSVKKFPILQMKIDELTNTKVTKKFRDKVRGHLGKTVSDYLESVEKRGKDNLYDAYHHLTYWASHICNSKLQMQYHSDISKLFAM